MSNAQLKDVAAEAEAPNNVSPLKSTARGKPAKPITTRAASRPRPGKRSPRRNVDVPASPQITYSANVAMLEVDSGDVLQMRAETSARFWTTSMQR